MSSICTESTVDPGMCCGKIVSPPAEPASCLSAFTVTVEEPVKRVEAAAVFVANYLR